MDWSTNKTGAWTDTGACYGVMDVVEVPLLMTAQQAAELEAAAHECGLTVAQALREIVRDFLVVEEGRD